jgi:hypothetical protein
MTSQGLCRFCSLYNKVDNAVIKKFSVLQIGVATRRGGVSNAPGGIFWLHVAFKPRINDVKTLSHKNGEAS